MAVSAPYFAFGDLIPESLYRSSMGNKVGDILKFLPSHMIKLQNYRISYTAVYARVR